MTHTRHLRLLATSIGIAPILAACASSPTTSAPLRMDFVQTYERACLNEHRLSYEALVADAGGAGWTPIDKTHNPELSQMMAISETAMVDPEFPEMTFEVSLFSRVRDAEEFILVIDRVTEPDIITLTGCYLYDLDAVQTLDPARVTALLEHPIAYETNVEGSDYYADPAEIITTVWGPPQKYPRQFDTYLTFIPPGSPLKAQTGFDGLVLKTSASEPDD